VVDGAHASRRQSDFCKAGSIILGEGLSEEHLEPSGRMLDPKTQKITMIDLCFNTHHLQFDKDDMLWFSAAATTTSSAGST
jgi:hypothetical protein